MTGLLIFGPSVTGSQQYVGGFWSIGQAQSFVLSSTPSAMGGQARVLSGPCLFFSLKCQHSPHPLLTPRLHAICRQQLSRTVQSLRASGQLPPLPRHPEPELSPKPRLLINSDLHSAFPSYVFKRRSSQDSEELSISCRGKIDLSFPSSTCS